MRIKRLLIAGAVAAGAWTVGGSAEAGPLPEGCAAAMGTTCSYTALRTGGIIAGGNGWRVYIFREDHETISYGPRNITDVNRSAFKKLNAVKKGDIVFVKTTLPAAPCLCVCVSGTFGFALVGPDYNR